tara:strand:+ start:4706 stop:5266 length:561 start_codon:yes stop_codon:yes gene_type:complete
MFKFSKIFIIIISLSFFISCTKENKDNLLLDAEGGNAENIDNNSSNEIEVSENTAQPIEMEEVELTVEEKLASELIDVGDRVFFDYDESTISTESAETLNKQYQFLSRNPEISITINGHCDERGTREYNLALGERRASSVKNYLVSLGIETNRITVISYGKEKPTVEGHNDWAWAQNRTAITYINN